MNPRVTSVFANNDHTLTLTFNSGEVKIFDVKPLLDLEVFQELRNIGYFRKVSVFNGTVQWPHEQDICPDMLYLESHRVHQSPQPEYS